MVSDLQDGGSKSGWSNVGNVFRISLCLIGFQDYYYYYYYYYSKFIQQITYVNNQLRTIENDTHPLTTSTTPLFQINAECICVSSCITDSDCFLSRTYASCLYQGLNIHPLSVPRPEHIAPYHSLTFHLLQQTKCSDIAIKVRTHYSQSVHQQYE